MPGPETRNHLLIGGLALAVGFGAGWVAGSERARHAPITATAPAGHVHAPTGASGMASAPRGHTFTGKVDVPPHGELGHDLAAKILGEVACPCGGCTDMSLAECGCDVAKEAEGVAAHLFERGKNGAQVLTQLATRYGFEVPAATLARAEKIGAPHASEPLPDAGFMGLGIDRPLDIPTSARPKR